MKNAKYHNLVDLVFGMGIMYDQIMEVLDIKKFSIIKNNLYILRLGIYEVSDKNRTLEYLLHDFVKVSITIDDNRLRSNL